LKSLPPAVKFRQRQNHICFTYLEELPPRPPPEEPPLPPDLLLRLPPDLEEELPLLPDLREPDPLDESLPSREPFF